jgi:polar amino acid transport system substrate-binding protein
MSTLANCPHCGAVLPPEAPAGLCPRCLLQQGQSSADPAAAVEHTNTTSVSTAPTPAALGLLFPHLEVLDLLGQGGMGAVYKARQRALDRLVALKILPLQAERDPAFAERFAREARALARLQHPHIVTVYDSGRSGGLYYLLMEYVDGLTLRQALAKGPLTPSAALRIVSQLCAALQFAHEQGVVHRDIKPENILLTHRGDVKIADFGLAKLLGPGSESPGLTATWQVMGTRHYMAPEQEQRPLEVDHRADIYSLGVVFYELLTGELPLGSFAPPSHKAAVDARHDTVILRALAREPDQRYQHVSEVCAAVAVLDRPAPLPPRPKNRRKMWIAGAAVLAVTMLGFLLWQQLAPPSFAGQILRWGGDASGGAPYIIERGSSQPPTGFEAELAQHLAGKLGIPAEFVRKYWDMLPQDLTRGDIDVILNGYEWSPDRERRMASTIPYYVYKLQLIVSANSRINSWDDLRTLRRPSGEPLQVGVLSDSAGHRYVEKEFGANVQVVALSEEGSTGLLDMTSDEHGKKPRLDATVQDLPVAIYYIQQQGRAGLRLVGSPREPGYYVMYVRPNDRELRERLNQALRESIRNGDLQRIYEKYGLWNEDQQELVKLADDWPPPMPVTEPGWADYAGLLLRAASITVLLALLAMPLAIVLGLLVAVGRLHGPRWLDVLLTIYVELLRGTPVLMQLFVIYYLLPQIGITIDAFWAGMLGLAINYSAYEAENYRAGLLAIPRGQMEAALSLGMSTPTALWRVIIPQAVRLVIPPVTNDFISLFKDTSVCSVIAVVELTSRYRTLMVNHPQHVVQLGLMTALLYLLMSYPLSLVARRLEKRP